MRIGTALAAALFLLYAEQPERLDSWLGDLTHPSPRA
jgi:hypothetical protein